jgi:hypothetical protein
VGQVIDGQVAAAADAAFTYKRRWKEELLLLLLGGLFVLSLFVCFLQANLALWVNNRINPIYPSASAVFNRVSLRNEPPFYL